MNLYKLFRSLIPTPTLQVGTVISFSNGVATILLPDGAQAVARGQSATIGSKVFFRDGAIEGPAPSLTIETIDV